MEVPARTSWSGLACTLLGAVGLVGWALQVETLRTVLPGLPVMKLQASLAFALQGTALALHVARRVALARVVGLAAFAVALVIMSELLMGRRLGPEGALAAPLALGLLAGAASMILTSRRRSAGRALLLLDLVTFSVGLFTCMGHALGIVEFLTFGWDVRIALHAAVGLVLLGAGLLHEHYPEFGRLVTSGGAGGRLLRRFLPAAAAVLGPVLLGAVRVGLTGSGLLSSEGGLATLALGMAALMVGLTLSSASWLVELDHGRAAAQGALEQQAAELHDLFERAPCAYLSVDADGVVRRANTTALQWLGLAAGQVVGRAFAHLVAPEDREQATRCLEPTGTLRRPGGPTSLALLRGDGQVVHVLAESRAQGSAGSGRHVAMLDVTGRLHAEARLRALVDANLIGVLTADRDGRVLEANDEYLRQLGASREELEAGRLRWDSATPAEWRAADERALEQLLAQGRADPFEKEYAQPSGRRVPVLVGAAAVRGTTECTCFTLDLSARKEAEAAARELALVLEQKVAERTAALAAANEELEAFSYSVSHDLRAPLRAIDGFARILAEDHAAQLDGEAQRLLATVRASAARMTRLINDLLALSRVSRQALSRAPVDMRALAEAALDELRAGGAAGLARVTISPMPRALGDEGLLRVVWTNLLDNALKYSSRTPDPRVDCRGAAVAGVTSFEVEDHGCGFDPRHGERLFRPFQRLHAREEYDGTGIGLALVRRIITRHGGQVHAEGRPGEGATFSFTLPAQLGLEERRS